MRTEPFAPPTLKPLYFLVLFLPQFLVLLLLLFLVPTLSDRFSSNMATITPMTPEEEEELREAFAKIGQTLLFHSDMQTGSASNL